MSSLADIFASTNRILTRIHRDWQSEHERWHQLYLGPFDGILSSSLTCQSCSSQISINLEQFDCLPLSPVLSGSTLIFGCALLDCPEAIHCDTSNKIGTYSITLCTNFHNVPFYVAAPLTSIDLSLSFGEEIVIEERSPKELLNMRGGLGEQVAAS
ncbi:ubiquitin carboxyl-terminal hydrolase 27-like [Arachis ipaensis]|uniref:ubiquitin carboxyl-terminal hydrolase 27-like n=1 Tax=Arachis ipaensis TaxID=130454 RepID=UPI000A2B6391|nr:ubiquitin carboxyl-terminal hydrolase 27-like [Arachis ipaensis]